MTTVKLGAVFFCLPELQSYNWEPFLPRGIFCRQTHTLGHAGLAWAGIGKNEMFPPRWWKLKAGGDGQDWVIQGKVGQPVFNSLHPWPLPKVSLKRAKGKLQGSGTRRRVERKKRRLRSPVDLTPVDLFSHHLSLYPNRIIYHSDTLWAF